MNEKANVKQNERMKEWKNEREMNVKLKEIMRIWKNKREMECKIEWNNELESEKWTKNERESGYKIKL